MSGGRKPMQDYSALYEYMTADDWEHLRQDGAPFLRNCERVFERAYQLGLRRPTEPTLATMAVIAQGGGATSGWSFLGNAYVPEGWTGQFWIWWKRPHPRPETLRGLVPSTTPGSRLDPDERPKRWGGDVRVLYAVCARTATVL